MSENTTPNNVRANHKGASMDWRECIDCGDDIHIDRWVLGYKRCLFCGEDQAIAERASWCVIQEYTKGNYMFVTPTSAHTTLKQTNPKENRV